MSESKAALRILAVAVDEGVKRFLAENLSACEISEIKELAAWESQVDTLGDLGCDMIVCGSQSFGVESIELAQLFRAILPSAPLFYASSSSSNMAIKSLTKNGFQQTFLLPADRNLFVEALALVENGRGLQTRKVFRPVTLVDLEPQDTIDFDVSIFLPINNKYIKVLAGGNSISKEKYDKFQNFQVSRVYVDLNDMPKFQQYTAERLKALNSPDSKISETERVERLQKSVRGLILNIFDSSTEASFDAGKSAMADTEKIVAEMIGLNSALDVRKQVADALMQPAESAQRSTRVSTFAALFEMAAGLKQTQMAAIAGLFLDLGLSTLPNELQHKPLAEMTAEERKLYFTHPAESLKLLQGRRMVVPPDVQSAILNHHERLDAKGFPNALPAFKISPLTQVVAAADRFEELMFGQGQRPQLDGVMATLGKEQIVATDIFVKISTMILGSAKKSA